MFVDKEQRPQGEVKNPTFAKAADLIEELGHAVWTLADTDGSICAFEAVSRSTKDGRPGTAKITKAHIRLEEWLQRRTDLSICTYNNYNTKMAVVSMLRRAAVEA